MSRLRLVSSSSHPGVAGRLLLASSLATVLAAGSAQADRGALFWAPPGAGASAQVARLAFAGALAARGIAVSEVAPAVEAARSLKAALAGALEAYRAMRIDEASAQLESVAAEAERSGGGDLDRRAFADLFLHQALCAQEQGRSDVAWEAFIALARLDPTRALDPAQIAPRSAAAYRRAVIEVGKSPLVELAVRVSADARVRIDGEAWTVPDGVTSVVAGRHYVQVLSDGDDPWRATINATPPRLVLEPTLRPIAPPRLEALRTDRSLMGALYRDASSSASRWRFLVSARLGSRPAVDVTDWFVEAEADRIVGGLIDAALRGGAPTPITATAGKAPEPKPRLVKRWWLWTVVGVSAAALAIGLPLGLTRDHGLPPGTAGGGLEPLR